MVKILSTQLLNGPLEKMIFLILLHIFKYCRQEIIEIFISNKTEKTFSFQRWPKSDNMYQVDYIKMTISTTITVLGGKSAVKMAAQPKNESEIT